MVSVQIGFSIEDRCDAVLAFLERLQPVLLAPDGEACELDFAGCRYLGPDAVALLAAMVLDGRRRGQTFAVHMPQGPPPLAHFWIYSGLAHLLGSGPRPDAEHPRSETVPVQVFSRANWGAPDAVVRLIRRHIDLSDDEEDALRVCMNEVAQNIDDHAASPIGGISCARFLSAPAQVRVAIVDRGLGIARTLASRFPDVRTPRTALERVFAGNCTSKSRPRNRGLGIQNLHGTVERLKGNLTIVTGNAAAETRSGRPGPRFHERAFDFGGTAVFFTLPVRGNSVLEE